MKAMCLTITSIHNLYQKVEITITAEDVYDFTSSKITSDGPNMYLIISFFCEQLLKFGVFHFSVNRTASALGFILRLVMSLNEAKQPPLFPNSMVIVYIQYLYNL